MIEKNLIKKLGEALKEAEKHLEWCGWGDGWERECAVMNNTPKQIRKAMIDFQKWETDND